MRDAAMARVIGSAIGRLPCSTPGGFQRRFPLHHNGRNAMRMAASTGAIPADDPWGAFADDQLG